MLKYTLMVAACVALVLATAPWRGEVRAATDSQSAPSFLRVDDCYAFTTPVNLPGPLLIRKIDADGWIEVELQAGAREGRRPYWLNLRSVISARSTNCSP